MDSEDESFEQSESEKSSEEEASEDSEFEDNEKVAKKRLKKDKKIEPHSPCSNRSKDTDEEEEVITSSRKVPHRKFIDDDDLPEMQSFRKLAIQAGYDPDDPIDHELLIEEEKKKTDALLSRTAEHGINKVYFKEVFLRAQRSYTGEHMRAVYVDHKQQ